jgi:dihydroneopterin aldolase
VSSALGVTFEEQAKRGASEGLRKVWSSIWANTPSFNHPPPPDRVMDDPFASDAILINRLHTHTAVGSDCWGKKRPQPLIVSIRLSASLKRAAETDDIQHTVNYGTLYKSIRSELGGLSHENDFTLADIANGIVARCIMPLVAQLGTAEPISTICIEAPKALLSGALWGYEVQTQGLNPHYYKYFVKGLYISVIIGVNPPERHSKQVVELDVEFYGPVQPDAVDSLVKVITPLTFPIRLTLFYST